MQENARSSMYVSKNSQTRAMAFSSLFPFLAAGELSPPPNIIPEPWDDNP